VPSLPWRKEAPLEEGTKPDRPWDFERRILYLVASPPSTRDDSMFADNIAAYGTA